MSLRLVATVALTFLCIVAAYIASIFWYRLTPFYEDCSRIHPGMEQEEVTAIMEKYAADAGFTVARQGALWGPGLYISSHTSGNQCNIKIRSGKVEQVELGFE